MLSASLFRPENSFRLTYGFTAFLILLIIAYVIAREWKKRL
ncbi:MAG TPA: hypothetical protein VF723_17070 [Pyrinomonadaceae bacterium]|jgi:hypothetical protein